MQLGNFAGLLSKIRPSVKLVEQEGVLAPKVFRQRVAEKNAECVVQQIQERSPVLSAMIAEDQLGIVGSMYRVSSGAVAFEKMSRKGADRTG